MSNRNARNKAILTSLLVTFFWSTSWVFIKLGLQELPPLIFAGLRYSLAVLCLLPFFVLGKEYRNLRSLTHNDWKNVIRLGVIGYAIAQGTLFIGLKLLPTMGVSLLLNLSPVLVTFIGISALAEKPTKFQWVGLILNIFGLFIYYGYSSILSGQGIGVLIVLAGMTANSISTIIGREMNKQARLSPLMITTLSMGIGSILMLMGGIYFEGIPSISMQNWLVILWMAAVNTALAFTLWNHALRELQAMQASIINGTMVIQIAMLAWIFLDETLGFKQIIGMLLVGLGTIMVQLFVHKEY